MSARGGPPAAASHSGRLGEPPARRALVLLLLLVLVGCGETGDPERAVDQAQAAAGRPNILLLMAEDLSPRVGAFGDAVAVTPALDRLAAEGVRFPNTFTTAGVCAPSRAALITGVHQMAIGAQHMRSGDAGYLAVPPPDVKAFPELLRRAGYSTFTDFKLDYQFSGTLAASGPFTIWDAEGRGTDWRDPRIGRPFFGLVNFHVTHESALFPRGGLPRSATHLVFQALYLYEFLGHRSVMKPERVNVPPYYPDTPTVRATLARHYDNIHRMDEQVGEIRRRLREDGLADSTILIWTSDHGDGLPRAKRELYDSGIRVPLIVYWPEALRPADVEPGSTDEQLVSFVDLAPTILGLAGVEAPDTMVGRVFTGSSPSSPPRSYVYAAKDRIDEVEGRERAVRDARFKYIRNFHAGEPGARRVKFRDHLAMMEELWSLHAEGRLEEAAARWFAPRPAEELYDTLNDPHEIHDLASDPAHARVLGRLRGALDAWLERTSDLGASPEDEMAERFWPGGAQPATQPPRIELSPSGEGRARVTLKPGTPGASIGYRVRPATGARSEAWRVYAGPFEAQSYSRIEAKAVRYGWSESMLVSARVP
jgi:arylsulfatase A-like enzyme